MENNKKKIEKMLKGSEDAFILATKNGVATVGYDYEILAMLTMLIREVKNCEGVTEEKIEDVFRLSKMNDKEILMNTLEKIKKTMEEFEK